MKSPAQNLCPGCGVQIPEACVRCRDCGTYLTSDAQKLAEQQAADTSRPEWMVYFDGHQFGPFSVDDLQKAFAAETATVPREALVWKHGLKEWVPAHSVPELWASEPKG